MFFPIPSQPMDKKEESDILALTGCSPTVVDVIVSFAEKYRQSISADNILKNRKLGTRSLFRIARRLSMFPQDDDLNAIINRSLLAEFLPAVERMNLETLLEESKIEKQNALVRLIAPFGANFSTLMGKYSSIPTQSLKEIISCSRDPAAMTKVPLKPEFLVLMRLRMSTEWLHTCPTWTTSTTTAYKQG
jgi:hypothetical protein